MLSKHKRTLLMLVPALALLLGIAADQPAPVEPDTFIAPTDMDLTAVNLPPLEVTSEPLITPVTPSDQPDAASTPGGAGAETGIRGVVTIGPGCPVETEASPCPDQPYQTALLIVDGDGTQVATVITGPDGSFSVPLPPGVYVIQPAPGRGTETAENQQVTVTEAGYSEVSIVYDSGIR